MLPDHDQRENLWAFPCLSSSRSSDLIETRSVMKGRWGDSYPGKCSYFRFRPIHPRRIGGVPNEPLLDEPALTV